MPLELYESDDAIMNRSPQLRPTVVNYQPHEDVPPFLLQSRAWGDGKTNSPPSSAHSRRSSSDFRRHIRRAEPSLGDAVLLTTLAPNRPDIARQALERPLEPILAVDEEIDQSRFDSQRQQRKPSQDSSIRPVGTTSIPDASQNRKPFPTQSSSSPPDREPLLPPFNQLVGSVPAPRKQSLPSHGNHYPPPPPPMIQSPPHSSTASPPENKRSLPPLQTALAGLNHQLKSPFPVSGSSSVSSHSVGDGRKRQPSITLPPPPVPSQAPTPISYHSSPISGPDASGPSPVSQQPIHARSAIDKPDPQSPPKMSPSSPLTNYPTPIEPTIRSADERPGAAPQGNIYKCPFPGCTARAFQTQYLLKYACKTLQWKHPCDLVADVMYVVPMLMCIRKTGLTFVRSRAVREASAGRDSSERTK